MKIYTRRGDGGETGLFGGGRVPKDHPRVTAYGTVDELNAVIGVAIDAGKDVSITQRLQIIQNDLFTLGAHLATPPPKEGRKSPAIPPLPVGRADQMETWIDEVDEEVPPLVDFILPGGTPGASFLHLARTVCRRAERLVVTLGMEEPVDDDIIKYLNRLSDLLFAFARLDNHRSGKEDVKWQPGA